LTEVVARCDEVGPAGVARGERERPEQAHHLGSVST